jgi:hypothetical protein
MVKIERQKQIMRELAESKGLSEKVIQLLELLCEERFWRNKSINAIELSLNRLVTYEEIEQIKFIENAIINNYRGLVWQKKQPTEQRLSKVEQIINLFK